MRYKQDQIWPRVSTNPLWGCGGFGNPPHSIQFDDMCVKLVEKCSHELHFNPQETHRQSPEDFADGLSQIKSGFFILDQSCGIAAIEENGLCRLLIFIMKYKTWFFGKICIEWQCLSLESLVLQRNTRYNTHGIIYSRLC